MSPVRWACLIAAAWSLAACGDPNGPIVVPPLEFERDAHWPGRTDHPGVGDGRVLITNSLDDTISILDLARVGQAEVPELARVPIGLSPPEVEGVHHVVSAPSGEYYYVGLSNYAPGTGSGPHGAHGTGTVNGYALKVRASDNVRVGTVRVDRNPGDLLLSPDGKTLFVSHFDLLKVSEVQAQGGTVRDMDSRLAIIDAGTMERIAMVPACAAAHGIQVSPDGTRAYLSCASDEVAIVQLDDPARPVTRIPLTPNAGDPTTASHLPYAATLSPSGDELWVSCLEGRDLHVLDTATLTVDTSRRVTLPGGAMFGAFSPDGATLWMPHQDADGVAVVDTATGTILRQLPLDPATCIKPHVIVPAGDGVHGILVCEGNKKDPGTAVVIQLVDERVTSVTEVGLFPDAASVLRRAP